MSFIALYAENASVIGTYAERSDAVRAAVTIAMRRPDLSTEVGIAELDDADGHVIAAFVSASDLLAADDVDAVSVADAHDSAAPPTDVAELAAALARSLREAAPEGAETTVTAGDDGAITVKVTGVVWPRETQGREIRPKTIIAALPQSENVETAGEQTSPQRRRR